jgi:hypothetical protein
MPPDDPIREVVEARNCRRKIARQMGLKMSRMDEHADRLVSDGKVVQFTILEQRHKALERCADDFSCWATKVAADCISEKIDKPEVKKKDGGVFAIADQYTAQKNPSGLSANLENTILAIAELRIKPRYDVFHNKIVFEGHSNFESDFENVCLVIRHLIAHEKRFEPSKETMVDAVTESHLVISLIRFSIILTA